MENNGFQSDGNNQHQIKSNQTKSIYPSQPIIGQPYPTQPIDHPYPTQPGGQPYPSVPNYGQPQPGYGYPNAPPYNAAYQANGVAPQNQQQQQVVIVAGQPTPVYVAPPFVPMTGAIVLSCFVFWCFGWIFGLIAFILAMVGSSSASAGDVGGAIRLRNASYGVSIAGIVVCIIAIAIIAGILGSAASGIVSDVARRTTSSPSPCYYYFNGIRYNC